jgi:hypothetical protein
MLNSKGFTFIELLLIIAVAMVASVSVSTFAVNYLHETAVRDASEGLIGTLREAQTLAISGKKNSSWGTKYEPGSITLFRGDSFSSRDSDFDQVLGINPDVEISGFEEAVFESPSGRPKESFSSINISRGNVEFFFSLNSEGVAE